MYHARQYDSLTTEPTKYTGTFVNETEFSASGTSKNFTQMHVELLLEALNDTLFDFVRDEATFRELVQ